MSNSNEKVLDAMYAGWCNQDINAIIDCFTEDGMYEDRAMGTKHCGHDSIATFAAEGFASQPDFHVEYIRRFATERYGAGEWLIKSTWAGEFEGVDTTGIRIEFRGLSFYEFRNGKICYACDDWDYRQLMRQLGVISQDLRVLKHA